MIMAEVKVFVRFRPVFHNVDEDPEQSCIRSFSSNAVEMINLRNTKETLKYQFQQVFAEDSSQEEVFGTVVQPVLRCFTHDLENVSVFAYGPTGSGKTFTVLGSDEAPGFIPRTMRHLFARVRQAYTPDKVNAVFTMSYVEIYQEKVYDLLSSSAQLHTVRQDNKGNIVLPGLKEHVIQTFSDFESLFVPATNCRRIAKTKLNERSSRSHTILLIKLTTQEKRAPFRRKMAKLSIIDLAGSEDNRQTGNQGVRLKESSAINKSLHVLGKVVHALVKHQERIPYRDSKLTRLLQDSLGGSANTCIVVNVSPEISSIFDTYRALNFAVQSKSIINRPFTDECIMQQLPEDEEILCDVKENVPIEPIFSNSVKEQAKKRKLQVERFDQLQNLLDESRRHNSITSSPTNQKQVIEDIRNSSSFFKVLQQTPSKSSINATNCSNDKVPDNLPRTSQMKSVPTSNRNNPQVFTVEVKDYKCTIRIKPDDG